MEKMLAADKRGFTRIKSNVLNICEIRVYPRQKANPELIYGK
jgi:hypothetical protein